jgi:hypothetical protein
MRLCCVTRASGGRLGIAATGVRVPYILIIIEFMDDIAQYWMLYRKIIPVVSEYSDAQ